MWTPTAVLFFLVAAASAEYGFKVGTQYVYEINSKTLTSLQQVSQQYSGVLIRAQLTVTPVKEDELVAYISQPQKAQIHTTLPKGVEYEIPQNVVQYTPFTLSKEPFVIKLKEGVVDELVVDKELPIWEVNIIRSIVSQFQIDTQGRRIIPSKLNTVPQEHENTAVYKIMEDTVEGDCEVLYDITPLPKYILQRMPQLAPQSHQVEKEEFIDIMKTKNFSNCEQRPGYHFGLTGFTDWEPTTNSMGSFFSRSSVNRVIVSGSLKKYTIHSSVTTNKVILSPEVYNNQKGEVVSLVNVTLVSVQTGSQNVQGPKNPQTLKKLVYDFNSPFTSDIEAREKWDKRQEQNTFRSPYVEGKLFPEQVRNRRAIDDKTLILSNEGWYQETPKMSQAPETPFLPYFVGYEGHSIQHSKEVNVNQIVRKMTEQIGQQLQDQTQIPKENTLEKFSVLTRIIRTMNVKQLEQAVQEIYTPEKEDSQTVSDTQRNGWMVFRDALAQAGTGPALMTIVNLITTQKIKEEEAAQVVSTLPETARYPTPEYLNTFFELVKKPEVVAQKNLNASSIYAFTKLVRLAQVNRKSVHNRYPVHSFGYLTPQDDTTVTTVYIPYFAQQLEQAVREEDSHKIQTYIRALGNMAHPKIVEVFEPYLEGEKPMTNFQRTLTVVSLNKLAMVYPRLARSVLYKTYANTGEVYQVRVAAVYNLMKTNPSASLLQRMAQFTHEDPSNQVRSAVKAAIESASTLVSKSNAELCQNAQSAVNMLVPKVYGVQYSRLNLTDYLVKGLHLGYTQSLEYIGSEDSLIPKSVIYSVLGNNNGYKNTIVKVAGMISSVQNLYDLVQDVFTLDEFEQIVGGTEVGGQTFTLESIMKVLNIEHQMKEQVEGNFAFKFGTMQRFFAFDNHTVESLPFIINKISQTLSKGKVYNYQKIVNEYEVTIGLPTASGFPFTYTLKTPTYFGIKGKVQGEIPELQSTKKGFKLPQKIQITSNVEIAFSTTREGEISFVTPFDHQRYVAGYKRQLHANVPVKGSASLDVEKRHLQIEYRPVESKRGDYRILHYSTKPYTTVQDITEFKPVTETTKTKFIESNIVKEVNEHFGPKYLGMAVRLSVKTEKRNFDLKKIIYDLVQRHDITSSFIYPTAEDTIHNTDVDLYYDSKLSTAQTIGVTATYRQVRSKENKQTGTDTSKIFVPTTDSQSRVEQFYQQASSGIKGANVYVVDLGLKVQGQTPIQYVGTVAYARSPIDPLTKVIAYLHKTVGNENYEICVDGNVKDTYVSVVDYEKVVQAEPHTEVNFQLKFGDRCQSGAKVDFSGKLERSQERREYLQRLPQVQKCKNEMQQGDKLLAGCRNATLQAGLMDKYRFTVKYHGVPQTVQNITYQVYSVLRHLGYPYVTESIATQKDTHTEQIELDVNFSPDLKTASVYISAPAGVAQFRDVHVNKYARTIFVVHPVYDIIQRLGWSSLQQQYDAYCTLDKVHAKTFDNQTYQTHVGNNWHVMTISVPKVTNEGKFVSVHNFAVLVREDSSNQKEVQIVFDYPKGSVVQITPSQGKSSGSMSINGQQVHFDEKGYYEYHNQAGRVIVQGYILPTGELKIVAPEHRFEFLYDKARVQLILSQEYKNRVGGLCGVYDGEYFNYVTPQGYILQDPEEFAATWAVSNEGRIAELKKKAQEHSLYKKTVVLTNVVSGQDTGKADTFGRYHENGMDYDLNTYGSEENQGNQNRCSTKRIMVIERDGKHCFSVHPQTACKPGCQVEKTRTMNAEFICVNKTQTSSHWAEMVARGAQPNFKNKGNAQKMQFEGPEICSEA